MLKLVRTFNGMGISKDYISIFGIYFKVFLLLAALLALAVAVPAPGPNPKPSPQFFYSAGYPAVAYASPYVYYG